MKLLLLAYAFTISIVGGLAWPGAVSLTPLPSSPIPPVELTAVRLSSSAKGVLVNWIISDTIGTVRYEVLRSIDGASWTTIHTLEADRALVLLDESFTDPIPVEGYNAYCIAALKQDGQRIYSSSQRIYYFPFAANSIFPNPVRIDQPFNLMLNIPTTSDLDVEIVDDKGNRVEWFERQATGQMEQFQFVHHMRSPGNYAVTVFVDGLPAQSFPLQVR